MKTGNKKILSGILVGIVLAKLIGFPSSYYTSLSLLSIFGILLGSMTAAAISETTFRKSIVVGLILGIIFGVAWTSLIYLVQPASWAYIVNSSRYSLPPLFAMVIIILTAIVGGIGGLIGHYILIRKKTSPSAVDRNFRIVFGVFFAAFVVVILEIFIFRYVLTMLAMVIGGIIAAFIIKEKRRASMAAGIITVIVVFIFGGGPASGKGSVTPNTPQLLAFGFSLLNLMMGLIIYIIYMALGGVGGLIGYYISKNELFSSSAQV